jgi:Ca2+-binding RTX toxin-like protein
MEGGAGGDTYFVDNRGDTVFEGAVKGIDQVNSSVSFSLAAQSIETLTLTGTTDLKAVGNELANTLIGNAGDNGLNGAEGKDALDGKGGADKLIGSLGADRLTGGAGADDFIFRSLEDSLVSSRGRDTIADFKHAQDDDIVLSPIDANDNRAGNQTFSFIGDHAFSGKAGELRYVHSGDDSIVQADTDGDGKADLAVTVADTAKLVAGDFLL